MTSISFDSVLLVRLVILAVADLLLVVILLWSGIRITTLQRKYNLVRELYEEQGKRLAQLTANNVALRAQLAERESKENPDG